MTERTDLFELSTEDVALLVRVLDGDTDTEDEAVRRHDLRTVFSDYIARGSTPNSMTGYTPSRSTRKDTPQ